MKPVELRPLTPFFNHVEIEAYDFPEEKPEGRYRATFDIVYSAYVVDGMKENCPDLESAVASFEQGLHGRVHVLFSPEYEITKGLPEVLEIIQEHIRPFYTK